jgi:hypothetical protein
MPRWDPILSTSRPITTDAVEAETKNSATANPRAADPKPISSLTWTASPPVRKAGSTVAVATATARMTARRFKASRPSGTPFSAER